MNYCPSLEWLRVGDKIGMKRTHEGNLKFYINGEDMGIAVSNIPEMVYAVIDLFGNTVSVNITSSKQQNNAVSPNASMRLQDSLELLLDPMPLALRKYVAPITLNVVVYFASILNVCFFLPIATLEWTHR